MKHARTERLELREFTMNDVPVVYALESLPEVIRYQDFQPRSWTEAESVVAEIVRNQTTDPRNHVELAVILDGTFIGRVGSMISEGKANLWYSFMPSAQGKGHATEAMKAFIPMLGDVKLEIECDPRNIGSCKLAERLGFKKTSFIERAYESKGEWVGSVVYSKEYSHLSA